MNQENFNDLKLYTNNIIEINKDVSLLIIYPPSEQIFIIPDADEAPTTPAPSSSNNFNNIANLANITQGFFKKNSIITKSDHRPSISNNYHMYLPIQIFETLNLYTYDRLFIKHYSKLSTSIDIEYNSTLQFQREAFSNEELNFTKQKLAILLNQQHKLDDLWKDSRWIIDIINNVRDRNKITGVSLDFINEFCEKKLTPKTENAHSDVTNKEQRLLKHLSKIPSVIVHNENDIEEQTSTLVVNDEIFDNKEFKNLSVGYHSEDRFFERASLKKTNSIKKNNNDDDNEDTFFSSVSFINLKNINKATIVTTSKASVISTNVSPTSSSTSTSSISASASSASSSSSAHYACSSNSSQKFNFDIDPKHGNIDFLLTKSSSNNETKNCLHAVENTENEPIEHQFKYSKNLNQPDVIPTQAVVQNSSVTSLTQSFSSLIASVYNFKTIVVHLAIDNSSQQKQETVQFKMVNFKINNNTTASDVIKYTLNAYDIPLENSKIQESSKKSPLYPSLNRDENNNNSNININSTYCLVVVLGCRERVLKDNYCLFNLKDPWIHGRYYIRLIHDALAALKLDKKFTSLKEFNNNKTPTNGFNSNTNFTNNRNSKNLVFSDIDAKI